MSIFSNIRTVLTSRKLALVAAPLVLAGAAVPLMGAGPWYFGVDFAHRDHGRREVIVRTEPRIIVAAPAPVVIAAPACVEVSPYDLHISAYQARGGGAIMVFVNGSNRTGGYTTTLSADDCRGAAPILTLHNTAAIGICTQALSSFNINAAVRADGGREVRCITVRVADRAIEVPVTCVATL